MISLLALLCVAQAPSTTRLVAQERPLAVLLIATSKRSEGLPSTAEVLRAADLGLRRTTGLGVESPERLGITGTGFADCPPETILGCALSSASSAPAPPPFVITLTLLKIGSSPLRAGISIFDVAEGSRRRDGARDPALLEDALAEIAWSLRAVEVEPAGLDRFFAEAGLAMARFLADHRVLAPSAISVVSERPGKTVSLDGNVVGSMPGTRALVVDARAGKRTVRIEPADGYAPIELVLQPGLTSTAAFVRPEGDPPDPMRFAFRIAGPTLAVGGVTTMVVAVAIRGSARSLCLGRAPSDSSCEDLGNAHLGFDASGPPSTMRASTNPSGVDLLALGLALASAGGTLAIGGWWGELEEPVPWWLGLVAVGVGGALYGASALVGSP